MTGFVVMDYFPYFNEKMVSRSTVSVNRRKKGKKNRKRVGKKEEGKEKKTKEKVR